MPSDVTVSAAQFAAFTADIDERISNFTTQIGVLRNQITALQDTQTIRAFPSEEAQIREQVLSAFEDEFAVLLATINTLKSNVLDLQTQIEGVGANEAPWIIDLNAYAHPTAQVSWNTIAASTADLGFAFHRVNAGALNDEILWRVVLGKGTWKFDAAVQKLTTGGIATLYLDDTIIGTIDAYNGSTIADWVGFSGFPVTTNKLFTLKLKVTSQNVSSSGFIVPLQFIRIQRQD